MQFPPPEGDRGGTRFYIRVGEGAHTISLHTFWDDLILGSERFQSVRNTATALRLQSDHARAQIPELRETRFEEWAKQESFSLAKDQTYHNGQLRGSTDKDQGEVLPADYIPTVKPLAERRIVLAGYRLADVLTQIARVMRQTLLLLGHRRPLIMVATCAGISTARSTISLAVQASKR